MSSAGSCATAGSISKRDSRLYVSFFIDSGTLRFFDRQAVQQVLDCNESFIEIGQVILDLQSVGALQTESPTIILHQLYKGDRVNAAVWAKYQVATIVGRIDFLDPES